MVLLRGTIKDTPEKLEYVLGFQKGLNTLQDESLIDDNELSYSQNAMLAVDGIIKRSGTDNFGSESGSRVYGGTPFYTSASSNNRWIIREGGTSLKYYNGSNEPTSVSGATMTANKRTEFAMARDTLYVVNGTDVLTKVTISGGVPTASTFTALSTPTGLAVAPQGVTGSTTYSYRVSAVNSTGETLAAASVSIANGNATLSSSNFNRVSWNAVVGATGYVVYGRKPSSINGIGETRLASVGTGVVQYDDTGTDTPSSTVTPPEGNSTGGQSGSMVIYAMSRLFVSGDSNNPSRLYYSAGGTQIDDFSTAFGGGWVDVSKNDGDSITGIQYYQNAIYVWKNRSIWKFTFTSAGLPSLELITNEVGCCSHRTIRMVNNDLWFLGVKDGRAAVYSLGNVEGYFNSLRTTQRSLKIEGSSMLDSANMTYISNSCAIYFRNLYIVCVPHGSSTTNNRCYVFDSRFGSWVGFWDGIVANAFFPFQDSTGNEELYYCSETSGYIVKMFTGTDDNGSAITWKIETKSFMQNYFDQYKLFRNAVLWFKDVVGGSITAYVLVDGSFLSGSASISTPGSGIGAGFDIPGRFKAGTSHGTALNLSNSDQPTEILFTKIGRHLQFQLTEAGATSSYKLLGLSYRWTLLEGKPLPADNRVRLS